MFTAIRSMKEEPGCAPAASPRLRRRHSAWPPGQVITSLPGVPAAIACSGTRRTRPVSARFEPVSALKGVTTPVPRVLLSVTLAGPAPSGSTRTSRLCQGCSRPPRHHPDQAAPSFSDLLRQAAGEGLSPPLGHTAPHGADDQALKNPFEPLPRLLSHTLSTARLPYADCPDRLVTERW